jgi:hypothetical protein
MANGVPDDPGKAGLQSASELLKLTLTLSTGALVFGAGLIEKKLPFTGLLKGTIVAAWALLAIAAGAGIMAIAAIPMMQAKANYNLEDPFLTWPARVHQIAFVLGILCLGGTLATAFFRVAPTAPDAVQPPMSYTVLEENTATTYNAVSSTSGNCTCTAPNCRSRH